MKWMNRTVATIWSLDPSIVIRVRALTIMGQNQCLKINDSDRATVRFEVAEIVMPRWAHL